MRFLKPDLAAAPLNAAISIGPDSALLAADLASATFVPRYDPQLDLLTAAQDGDHHFLIRSFLDVADELLPLTELPAVDSDNLVARLETGRLGRRVGNHLGDARQERRERAGAPHLVLRDALGSEHDFERLAVTVYR